MKRILAGLVAAAIGAFALTGAGGAVSANAQANSVKVNAGNGEPGYAVNAFLPDSITITTGTTVSWQFPWIEPHTITFGTVTATTKPSPSPARWCTPMKPCSPPRAARSGHRTARSCGFCSNWARPRRLCRCSTR